jgi:integrase/recombinase XerD
MTPLRRRMIEDMQIRNLALNTQDAYVEQVERFARYFRKSPERLGPPEIRAWQLHLAQDRHLTASSIAVAVAALRFLYVVTLRRPWDVNDEIPAGRQSKPLPEVLSPEEVAAFLGAVKVPKQRIILTVCYAAGLRVSEAVALTPAAIDSQRMVIRVEAGKGQKDRYVMLSPRLLDMLRGIGKRPVRRLGCSPATGPVN